MKGKKLVICPCYTECAWRKGLMKGWGKGCGFHGRPHVFVEGCRFECEYAPSTFYSNSLCRKLTREEYIQYIYEKL